MCKYSSIFIVRSSSWKSTERALLSSETIRAGLCVNKIETSSYTLCIMTILCFEVTRYYLSTSKLAKFIILFPHKVNIAFVNFSYQRQDSADVFEMDVCWEASLRNARSAKCFLLGDTGFPPNYVCHESGNFAGEIFVGRKVICRD